MAQHSVYCEPFGGSAGVLLNKQPTGIEIYNELNMRIFNLMCVLKSKPKMTQLCQKIELTKWCKSNWESAHTQSDDPVEDALNVLIRSWLSFSPVGIFRGHTGYRTGAYDKSNVLTGHQQIWKNLPQRIDCVHQRVKRLHMFQLDAQDVIDDIDRRYGDKALYYVDPPYLHSTRVEKRGYENEMSIDDHASLLNTLSNVRGKVLLSGYRNSLYDTMLTDSPWNSNDFQSYAASNRGSVGRKEVLWTNFQPVGMLRQSDLFL